MDLTDPGQDAAAEERQIYSRFDILARSRAAIWHTDVPVSVYDGNKPGNHVHTISVRPSHRHEVMSDLEDSHHMVQEHKSCVMFDGTADETIRGTTIHLAEIVPSSRSDACFGAKTAESLPPSQMPKLVGKKYERSFTRLAHRLLPYEVRHDYHPRLCGGNLEHAADLGVSSSTASANTYRCEKHLSKQSSNCLNHAATDTISVGLDNGVTKSAFEQVRDNVNNRNLYRTIRDPRKMEAWVIQQIPLPREATLQDSEYSVLGRPCRRGFVAHHSASRL